MEKTYHVGYDIEEKMKLNETFYDRKININDCSLVHCGLREEKRIVKNENG